MLQRIAETLASTPGIYEIIQQLAGQHRIVEQLERALAGVDRRRALDVGSAAGALTRRFFPNAVGVDIDLRMIAAIRKRTSGVRGVAANAASLPFGARAFETTLCIGVAHHLDAPTFEAALAEIARVTSQRLVFVDAVRNERRLVSSMMWRFDRGHDPRPREELLAALAKSFTVESVTDFSHLHQYLLCVATPKQKGS